MKRQWLWDEVKVAAKSFQTNGPDYCQRAAPCWWLTCVSVQDLAAVGEQLEHFELAAVSGHHDVAVVFAQELHVQHLVAVAHKLAAANDVEN